MQWSLFLVVLMGQCFFFTCHLYEYHFISKNKTWDEAQRYCRENYTDLAIVFDMEDVRRLQQSTENQGEAWIGLHNNSGGENRRWQWSLPGVEYTENNSSWNSSEPNDGRHPENCVKTKDKWADEPCSLVRWFVYYDETKKDNKTLHSIKENMNWTQAQNYCRYNHTDLASGRDQVEGEELKNLTRSESPPKSFWIGLFRDSWRWSDGSNFSFRHWDMELFNDEQSNKNCAVTLLNRSGTWSSDDCNNPKPFFCYQDKVILIKENKTWEEALDYCRQNHSDLVSITTPKEQRWAEERAKQAHSPHVWLGLRYTCTLDLWFWVSDELMCFEKWATGGKTEECGRSAAMDRGGQHEWVSHRENETFNFICSTL